MQITIFKAGKMIGPLDQEELAALLVLGEVCENDLAQRDGVEVWIPLHRLFPRPKPPTRAERWLAMARKWAMAFWAALNFNPLRIGLACLLAGCVLMIFPRWTLLLFVPLLVGAVFAGALLLTRSRYFSGAALSLAAVVLPLLFLIAGNQNDGGAVSRMAEAFALPHPSIEAIIHPPKPPPSPAKPTPLQSFGGVAFPQPVKPTPTPKPVPSI